MSTERLSFERIRPVSRLNSRLCYRHVRAGSTTDKNDKNHNSIKMLRKQCHKIILMR